MGFLSDIVNGKEKKYKADPLAVDINAAGKSGLSMLQSGANELNEQIYSNPNSYVNNQIDVENKLLRSATDDATRRTRQMIAQRGMGSSSIGLGQEMNQARTLNDRLALNNASGMERLKGVLNDKMQTGNQLYGIKAGQGIQMQDQTQRVGGYGQLLAAGISAGGAMMGKPSAAAAVKPAQTVAYNYSGNQFGNYA